MWRCDTCVAGGHREARGACGGPFRRELLRVIPPAQELPDGTWEGGREMDGVVEVSGHFTLRPSAGMSGVYFRSCPVAAARDGRLIPLAFRAHRLMQANALHMLTSEPSNALIDAVETVADALAALNRYERESRSGG